MHTGRWAAGFGFAAALGALVVPIVGGASRDGYDHTSQFISELGERGADDGGLVSWFGFVPVGLLTIAFAVLAARALSPMRRMAIGVLLLGGGVGAAYVVSAGARCEAGCPTDGDVAQTIHNLGGGALEYVGAAAGLVVFGLAARSVAGWRLEGRISLALVPIVVVLAGVVDIESTADWRGLIQRVVEVAIFGWVVMVSRRLWADGSPATS